MAVEHMPPATALTDRTISAGAKEDGDTLDAIAAEVREFCAIFPIPGPHKE